MRTTVERQKRKRVMCVPTIERGRPDRPRCRVSHHWFASFSPLVVAGSIEKWCIFSLLWPPRVTRLNSERERNIPFVGPDREKNVRARNCGSHFFALRTSEKKERWRRESRKHFSDEAEEYLSQIFAKGMMLHTRTWSGTRANRIQTSTSVHYYKPVYV